MGVVQVPAAHQAPLPAVRGRVLRALQRGAHAAAPALPGGNAAASVHQLRGASHAAATVPGRCAPEHHALLNKLSS